MSHSAMRFGVFSMLIRERERVTKEEEGENHPILEHCSSQGLPEVVGEEEAEMEKKEREKERKKVREGNGGAWEDRRGLG